MFSCEGLRVHLERHDVWREKRLPVERTRQLTRNCPTAMRTGVYVKNCSHCAITSMRHMMHTRHLSIQQIDDCRVSIYCRKKVYLHVQ